MAELQQPWIEAARVMGTSHMWIFTRHFLQHLLGLVVVYASANAAGRSLCIAKGAARGAGRVLRRKKAAARAVEEITRAAAGVKV